LALGFSSGHDLLVGRSSPASGSLLSKESASPLLLPLQLVLSLSNKYVLGAWVVQLVECLTPGFRSGHRLGVVGSKLVSGSVLGVEPAWGFLSPFTPPPPISKKEKKKDQYSSILPRTDVYSIFMCEKSTLQKRNVVCLSYIKPMLLKCLYANVDSYSGGPG